MVYEKQHQRNLKNVPLFAVTSHSKREKTNKSLLPAFITPNGLLDNMYARKISREVKSDALFV